MVQFIEYMFVFIPGVVCALVGFRLIGPKLGESHDYDVWHDQYGRYFRWAASFLLIYGCASLLVF